MMNEEDVVSVLNAMADKTRLRITRELLKGERPCAELIARFHLSKSTFSHHAKVLARCGLVRFRREGRFLYFSLNQEILSMCLSMFAIKERRDENEYTAQ